MLPFLGVPFLYGIEMLFVLLLISLLPSFESFFPLPALRIYFLLLPF